MVRNLRILIPIFAIMLLIGFGASMSVNQAQTSTNISYGSNWTAIYYGDTNFSDVKLSTTGVSQINFTYGTASPALDVPSDFFSIRFTSLEQFAAGTYRFTARADDGVRVTIDGSVIINELRQTGSDQLYQVDVAVSEGTREIIVDFVEYEGNAVIQFFWEGISVQATGTEGPSPTPTATGVPPIPAGALAATVIRAGVLNTRDAPSLGGNVVRRILRGQTYQVVGRDPDARWFLLNLGDVQAWAYGYYLYINGNEFTAPVRSAAAVYAFPAGFTDTGVLVQTCATMRLRAEPNLTSAQTGRITWGSFLPVTARTPAGDWYQVLWKGTIGWMYSGFTWYRQGEYGNVPVVSGFGASNNNNPYPPITNCSTSSASSGDD